MPTFPYTIHDKNYDFLPKGYFLAYPVDNDALFGRQTFSTMSPLDKEREVREHRESGSKRPWQGGSVETPADVTFARGIGLLDNTQSRELEDWYDNPIKYDLYVDVFPDGAEDIDGGTDIPSVRYLIYKCKPKKYKAFEGDAKSSDTAMEELVVANSGWNSVPVV